MSSIKKIPAVLNVLLLIQFTVSAMGIYGGTDLLLNSEDKISNSAEVLARTPFHSFFIPGLILAILLGIIPMILIVPLITKHSWKFASSFNIFKNRHWAWTFSLFCGLAVIIWSDVQFYMIGYSHKIQIVFAMLGLLMVIFAVWPSVMNYYRLRD